MTDSLVRDDLMGSQTAVYDRLPAAVQKVLLRAASRGRAAAAVGLLAPVAEECGGWLMVPSRRGLRQVVISEGVAFRI